MRLLRTTEQLHAQGLTRTHIRSGARVKRWTRIVHGVYGAGDASPSPLDVERATALATNGVGTGALAGVLLLLDGVVLDERRNVVVPDDRAGRRRVRRVSVMPTNVIDVGQVRCTDGPTTLWDLARRLDDVTWEQAVESALHRGLVLPADVEAMAAGTTRAAARVRRVIRARGGLDIPPTESLLETLAVQLMRSVKGLPPPERQVALYDEHGNFVARVDLAWPSLGIFVELDGQQHKDQPVYDASRQTAIAGVTGWLCGRFTWDEITRTPAATARRMAGLLHQAHRRPQRRPQGATSEGF